MAETGNTVFTQAGLDEFVGRARNPEAGVALNPYLHGVLVQQYGDVLISKQGVPMVDGSYTSDNGRLKFSAVEDGEYYRINCPFCIQHNDPDGGHRLWINHRWGVGLDNGHPYKAIKPDDKFWWAAVCFHNDCMANPENVKALRSQVYGSIGRERHAETIRILPGTKEPTALGLVGWPGDCLRVDMLQPTHVAYQYLLGRGFDPKHLGPHYDVSFCQAAPPELPLLTNRIVVPIKMRGEMVGWQARPPYEAEWKLIKKPKYYNHPQMSKSLMLYGFDDAIGFPCCILVEGVTDVWAVGAPAMAMLGKTLSSHQANLIAHHWPIVILAFDSDAQDRVNATRLTLGDKLTVIPVCLPDGLDPATIDQEYFWELIDAAAATQGINLRNL